MTTNQRLEIACHAFLSITLTVIYYSVRAVWKVGFFIGYWLIVGCMSILSLFIAGITFIGASIVNSIIHFFDRCLKSR